MDIVLRTIINRFNISACLMSCRIIQVLTSVQHDKGDIVCADVLFCIYIIISFFYFLPLFYPIGS